MSNIVCRVQTKSAKVAMGAQREGGESKKGGVEGKTT